MIQTLKPFIISLIIILAGYAGIAYAAPYFRQEASLVPIDSTENVGTSTNRWAEGWFGSLNVSGTCTGCGLSSYDAWAHPSAGVSATTSSMIFTNASSTFTGNLNISGNSTTTNATTTNALYVGGYLSMTGTNHFFTHGIQALDSAGLHFHSNNGTEVAFLGAGGGANVTWLGSNLFSGITTDITTGTNEDFTITPNGTGKSIFSTGFISSASSTVVGNLNITGNATTTSATTTNFNISGQSLTLGSNHITGTTTKSFNIASTTLDAMGKSFNTATSTFLLANFPEAMILRSAYCTASTTGTALLRFGDPTGNYTETASVTTGGTTYFSTNNTWTANEGFTVQASSTAGQVSRLSCTATLNVTAP